MVAAPAVKRFQRTHSGIEVGRFAGPALLLAGTVADFDRMQAPNGAAQNIITTADPEVHARMRKLLGNSFSEQALRTQQSLIESYGDLFIDRLRKLATAPDTKEQGVAINIVDWVTYFTTDIIGDLSFGESFNCLRDSRYHPWVQALYDFFKGMNLATAPRFYPGADFIFQKLIPKSVNEAVRQHTNFINEKIQRRLNLETDRPDFMTPIMKDENFQTMSLDEIQSTFSIIVVAGSETTATTLCGTLNYITRETYRPVLQKLVAEIRSTFEKEDPITIETTQALPYLNTVLNEGLRLCNPVPGGLYRAVPKGGGTYAGYYVPEGTSIAVRPYVMNRSEKLFSRPREFIPERWLPLEQRPAEFLSDQLLSSNPFSIGAYSCLGKPLAWAEMRLLLTRFLWAFDVAEEPGRGLDWEQQQMLVMIHKEPFHVRIKARAGASSLKASLPD